MAAAQRPLLPSGTSIRLVLARCGCPDALLTSHLTVEQQLRQLVRRCGLTDLEAAGHDFAGGGHTLCLLLAESHVTIHTYPERSRSVVAEVSVCDYRMENREAAQRLADHITRLFCPEAVVKDVQGWGDADDPSTPPGSVTE